MDAMTRKAMEEDPTFSLVINLDGLENNKRNTVPLPMDTFVKYVPSLGIGFKTVRKRDLI
jgi:hypothetical protein